MSRFARQIAEEEAKLPKPIEPDNGQQPIEPDKPSGPRYEIWRPWYQRLLAKGCARCGGEPPGWVQRQIQTSYRFKRFVLWTVNLIPRLASLLVVVLSKRVQSDVQAERDAKCGACPSMVIRLRVHKGVICETKWCGECSCPKWFGSRLDYKNTKIGHRCPLKLHHGSDPNAVYANYVRAKQAAATETGGN